MVVCKQRIMRAMYAARGCPSVKPARRETHWWSISSKNFTPKHEASWRKQPPHTSTGHRERPDTASELYAKKAKKGGPNKPKAASIIIPDREIQDLLLTVTLLQPLKKKKRGALRSRFKKRKKRKKSHSPFENRFQRIRVLSSSFSPQEIRQSRKFHCEWRRGLFTLSDTSW